MAGTPPHVKTKMEIYEDGVLLKYAGKDADEGECAICRNQSGDPLSLRSG
jgi:hypothetical protein